jgi:alkyldihydroxyacetonephosphate synthase
MVTDTDALSRKLVQAVGAPNLVRGARELLAAGVPVGPGVPAWLVRPGATAEIAEVVQSAAAHGVQVAPVGAASRPRDFSERSRGLVAIDMRRMNHVLHLDETSLLVHAQAGLGGVELEALLLPRGLTLGDFPPAALTASLGGMLAVRTPGKTGPRHGFLEDAVLGISAVLPDGRIVHTRLAPRRATGPDLARAVLGAEGRLGVITQVVLRIHRRAESRRLLAFALPSLGAGVAAVREALRRDVRPAAVRVYDPAEAAAHLGGDALPPGSAVLTCALAGPAALVGVEAEMIGEAVALAGGQTGALPWAETWWRRRTGASGGGLEPPPPSLVLWAEGPALTPAWQAMIDAAASVGRRARAHVARFDDHGSACLFVTLVDGERPDPHGPARPVVLAAAKAHGAFVPGEVEPGLEPYFADLHKALDPDGIMG